MNTDTQEALDPEVLAVWEGCDRLEVIRQAEDKHHALMEAHRVIEALQSRGADQAERIRELEDTVYRTRRQLLTLAESLPERE